MKNNLYVIHISRFFSKLINEMMANEKNGKIKKKSPSFRNYKFKFFFDICRWAIEKKKNVSLSVKSG